MTYHQLRMKSFVLLGSCVLACAGCESTPDSGPSANKDDALDGKADGADICVYFGYDQGCDLCAEEGWYADDVCDQALIDDGICQGPDPVCESDCRPVCDAIGSRSEGWYDSCTGGLIGWAQCAGCEAQCDAVGSRSEGWYDSCGQGMNGTGLIAWASCGESPDPRPCQPECRELGTRSEGWYDPCTDELIGWAECDGCVSECDAEGTRSEGWYDSCGVGQNGTGLIAFADCAEASGPEPCTPVCDAIGTRGEGWYDSCSGELIGWGSCDGCIATCDAQGSRSEGWYDSCGHGMNGTGLIMFAECGEDPEPPGPCTPECAAVGSRSEGWYDGCSGELIGWTACDGCEAVCDAIGSRSEGWYDSCGQGMNGTGVIQFAQCSMR